MSTVAILDYGGSNLRSVAKAVEHVAGGKDRVKISSTRDDLRAADRVVFPGQGAIGDCMANLRRLGLEETVGLCARSKPFLGICLGLQSLMDTSDEDGGTAGMGLYAGTVKRFPKAREIGGNGWMKIPHMGWNQVTPAKPHGLWENIEPGARFYFVHSYYVDPADPGLCAAKTDYAVSFTSAIADGYVFAVQFHPEKSQRAGLQLLRNFLDWDGG